jgi:hypothetical protein
MMTARAWRQLTKAEKKEHLEQGIDGLIDELERRGRPLTEWEVAKVIGAIDSTRRGLFDYAATQLADVFATNVAEKPWPNSQTKANAPTNVETSELRAELDRLKFEAVAEHPIFG